jgi:hypothetical protein
MIREARIGRNGFIQSGRAVAGVRLEILIAAEHKMPTIP